MVTPLLLAATVCYYGVLKSADVCIPVWSRIVIESKIEKKQDSNAKRIGLISKSTQSGRSILSNCVKYMRSKTAIAVPNGLFNKTAKRNAVNSTEPSIGAPVFTSEGRLGHAAIVQDIDYESNRVLIEEANYQAGKITHRWLSMADPRIMGYRK